MRISLRITLWVMVVVAAVTVVNAVIPAQDRITDAVPHANTASTNRPTTSVKIIYVGVDAGRFNVHVFVKNLGEAEITAIDSSEIFFKTPSAIVRLPYNAGSCNDCWSYSIEGDTLWNPSVTVRVTLHLTNVAPGDYSVRFVTPSGAAANKEFTV